MAKRKPINYYPTRDCYRKHYHGKARYFATRKPGESNQDHYERALAEWAKVKAEIDLEAEPQKDKPQEKRVEVDINLPRKNLHNATFFHDYSADPDLPPVATREMADLTIAELIGSYLAETRLKAECGDLAISSYREVKDCLTDFRMFCERHSITHVNRLSSRQFSEVLRQYRLRQQELQSGGQHSAYTTKKRLRHVKCLIEWAYHNEMIDVLPRSIGNGYTKVRLPDPTPQELTLDEITQLWHEAECKGKYSRKDHRNCLFILLGLNCGYRSGDIATLEHGHVDFESLIVRRKRHKTGAVSIHKLWPLTAEILQKEMTDPAHHKLMLLDERGQVLVRESLDAKTGRLDSIARRFSRLRARLGWPGGKGHSVLRDTGAQFLKDTYGDLELVKQYLAHKVRDVSRHYVSETIESRQRLFDALDQMRQHFNLTL